MNYSAARRDIPSREGRRRKGKRGRPGREGVGACRDEEGEEVVEEKGANVTVLMQASALRPHKLCTRGVWRSGVRQEGQTGSKCTTDAENTCLIMSMSSPAGPGGLHEY